jgi:hypothetical protein
MEELLLYLRVLDASGLVHAEQRFVDQHAPDEDDQSKKDALLYTDAEAGNA